MIICSRYLFETFFVFANLFLKGWRGDIDDKDPLPTTPRVLTGKGKEVMLLRVIIREQIYYINISILSTKE